MTIAIGCTGGQHRSVAVAEELTHILTRDYPDYQISVMHRELEFEHVAANHAVNHASNDHHNHDGARSDTNGGA